MIDTTHTTEQNQALGSSEVTAASLHGEVSHEAVSSDHGAADGHASHEATLFAEPVAHAGAFPITNALVTSWAAVFIIIALSIAIRSVLKSVPGKLQHAFEIFIEGALSIGDQVTNNRKITEKVFPIVAAVFFFVLINNWLGLLPLGGLGLIQHGSFIPFLRSGTADINTTLALAVIAVIGANIFGIMAIGGWKMLNKYINLKALSSAVKNIRKDPTGLIVAPIKLFVGIIEIIGEAAKVASLSFRLFGNVFAGEVLLASMGALIAYAVPIPFLLLEIIVGIVQAFIFAMLTVVYFTIAASDHDHDEHDAHNAHDGHHSLPKSSNSNEEIKVAISN